MKNSLTPSFYPSFKNSLINYTGEFMTTQQYEIISNYISQITDLSASKFAGTHLAYQFGVNIEGLQFGDTVIPGTVGTNYFAPFTADIDVHYNNGARIFRIPFLWERMQVTLGGAIDTGYFNLLKTATDYILSKSSDTTVIWDCHNYSARNIGGTKYQIGTTEVPLTDFVGFWKKLGLLGNYSQRIHYCLMNEPIQSNAVTWAGYMQTLVNELRENNVANTLQISGISYTSVARWYASGSAEAFKNFNDPMQNYVFEAHAYFDLDQDGSSAGNNVFAQYAHYGYESVKLLTEWARRYGHKIHIGETATADHALSKTNMINFIDFVRNNQDVYSGVTFLGGTQSWTGGYPFKLIGSIELQKYFEIFADGYPKQLLDNYPSESNINKVSPLVSRIYSNNTVFYLDFENEIYDGCDALSDVLTFTRASKGYGQTKKNKRIVFDNDAPRITDLGLLLESASTNLINGQNIDITTLTNATFGRNYLAPDGTLNAIRMTDNATSGAHWLRTNCSLVGATQYTMSANVKNVDFNLFFHLMAQKPDTNVITNLTIPTAVMGANEWIRPSLTMTHDGGVTKFIGYAFAPNASASLEHVPDSYVGTGKSIDLWHPQVEAKPYMTSPIIGASAGASRSADAASLIANLLTTLQGDFTIILKFQRMPIFNTGATVTALPIFTIKDGASANICQITRTTDYQYRATLYTAGTVDSGLPVANTNGNRATGGFYGQTVGLAFDRTAGRVSITAQGATGAEVTGLTSIPAVASAFLEPLEGYIQVIAVMNTAKTLTELNAIVNHVL